MKKIIRYAKKIFSANDADVSSKRITGVGAAFSIIVIAFTNMFTGKAPEPYVLGALVSVVAICFGGVAVENVGNMVRDFKLRSNPTPTSSGGIPKANL